MKRGLLLMAALLLAACGQSTTRASDDNPTLDTATVVAAPSTTTRPTGVVTIPAPTTVALPVPVPSPGDPRADEPDVVLGTIEIPKIGINHSMREGVRLTTLDKSPGHWPGSAMPGQVGNMVIAGHRVTHGKPFRNLDRLTAGDDVRITLTDGKVVTYRVSRTEIVPSNALWIVNQTPEATGTLFACHPPGSARQRIVVHLALSTA